ncbi:family 43 glycosylhydrolase [Fulvivirga maritima]|uniref:family 43 glycosylhydrolase n=1 Tax=Fulvivirga maritima TaxID=2904247 RepID=UPI001F173402|nr:family 43 glycosylhydrolase [Fulvivirga maritima]UII27294.1 family 43 glycosylhydrolase [Fulvivirga maritima]
MNKPSNYILGSIILIFLGLSCSTPTETESTVTPAENAITTVCNPLNISCRFALDSPSRREAADPSVIAYKDQYLLFASKSGGYWSSADLIEWNFIQTDEIPTEEYAPTAIVISDTVYFLASSNEKSTIYKSADPLSGHWQVAREELAQPVWDPAFFMDDDQRLYLYWGCSNVNPLYGVEIDYKNNFDFIGSPKELMHPAPAQYGWEVPGDYNTNKSTAPWIEGAWVNKYDGKYYLQYAGPGTEYKSYADAVYTGEGPLGPFELASHNPFSYKPEGFANGAGHGSTFQDKYGNYWHMATASISVKQMFERRLVLYPTFFDKEGVLHSITKFGDYPMIMPDEKINGFDDYFAGWMLLSYNKKVTSSSVLDSFPASNMVDEDIRTYWSAASGKSNEWATVDLGSSKHVHAIQVNFAEHNTAVFGRKDSLAYEYIIEISNDDENWEMLVDRSQNNKDRSHDYIQLPEEVMAQFIRIRNMRVSSGNFALSGLRVFGKGDGAVPEKVEGLAVQRNSDDKREVSLKWNASDDAMGYNIAYGTSADKLYHNYKVYDVESVQINSLDVNQKYYFNIQAFNENGIGSLAEVQVAE